MRRWNNRRKCFRLPVLGLAAALLFVMLSSCGDTSESVQPNTAGLEKYGQELILSDGWNELAGVGNLKLSIDKESLSVSVENTVTGKVWRTNSLNPEEDTTAQGTSKDMLKAQFQLYYYDTNGNLKTMNSFTDSIKFNQTKVFSIENGIAVHYLVGDTTRGESDIPAQISNQRFTMGYLQTLSDRLAAEPFYRAVLCNGEQKAEGKSFYEFFGDEAICFSTLKPAENENGAVLRLYNLSDKQACGKLRLPVSTKSIFEAMLSEDDVTQLKIRNEQSDSYVDIRLAPWQIGTYRIVTE